MNLEMHLRTKLASVQQINLLLSSNTYTYWNHRYKYYDAPQLPYGSNVSLSKLFKQPEARISHITSK